MDYRERILNELQVMEQKEKQDRNVFKARAYGKVIGQLRSLERPIRGMDDLQGIQGIGDRIREKITEILRTGHLAAADVVREKSGFGVVEEMLKIYGVGPVKAKDLVEKHGVRSIQDLRDKVAKDPGLLNDKQKLGLKYVEDLQQRIPRVEMKRHEGLLMREIAGVDARFEAAIVGSYRREAPDSGDIDVLLRLPKGIAPATASKLFQEVVHRLQGAGYIQDTLALGEKKCMAVCRIEEKMPARRIDLLLTPEDEYAYALLYFTGSDRFNIAFRKHALEKGYTLNEHTMTPTGDAPAPPAMATEEDIFAFLGVAYVQPQQRNGKKNL